MSFPNTGPIPADGFAELLPIRSISWTLDEFVNSSGIANGQLLTVERAHPKWRARLELSNMSAEVAREVRARINRVGKQRQFYLYPVDSKFPASDPYGFEIAGFSVAVSDIGSTRLALKLAGLPDGYRIQWGDFLSVTTDTNRRVLLQAGENETAGSDGETINYISTIPAIRGDVKINDPVSLRAPDVLMQIVDYSTGTTQIDGHLAGAWIEAVEVY